MNDESESRPTTPRPLLGRAARRAMLAPDLTRYLDRRSVDLAVTDQVDAIRVRIDRGLEVFERRLADAHALTVREVLGMGIALAAALAIAITWGRPVVIDPATVSAATWLTASVATGAVIFIAIAIGRRWFDLRRIRSLRAICSREGLEALETVDRLFDHADRVLASAVEVGAALSDEEMHTKSAKDTQEKEDEGN